MWSLQQSTTTREREDGSGRAQHGSAWHQARTEGTANKCSASASSADPTGMFAWQERKLTTPLSSALTSRCSNQDALQDHVRVARRRQKQRALQHGANIHHAGEQAAAHHAQRQAPQPGPPLLQHNASTKSLTKAMMLYEVCPAGASRGTLLSACISACLPAQRAKHASKSHLLPLLSGPPVCILPQRPHNIRSLLHLVQDGQRLPACRAEQHERIEDNWWGHAIVGIPAI